VDRGQNMKNDISSDPSERSPRGEEPQLGAWQKRAYEAERLAALLFQRYVDHPPSCDGLTLPRTFTSDRCTCGLRQIAEANQSIVAFAFTLAEAAESQLASLQADRSPKE
jgi:hypothetical protein